METKHFSILRIGFYTIILLDSRLQKVKLLYPSQMLKWETDQYLVNLYWPICICTETDQYLVNI